MKTPPKGTHAVSTPIPREGPFIDIRSVALVILAVSLALVYLFVQFRGFSISAAMDQAQISREIAKGNGYTTQYIRPLAIWQLEHAGKPTLLGVDYFRRVVELQKKHAGGRPVSNAIQTNGTRLDAEWCRFFRENQFLVGLSLDGPRKLHDTYRMDKGGKSTFDRGKGSVPHNDIF